MTGPTSECSRSRDKLVIARPPRKPASAAVVVLLVTVLAAHVSAQTCSITGPWQGTFTNSNGNSGKISASFTQTSTSFSGTVTVSDSKGTYTSNVSGTNISGSVSFGPVQYNKSTLYADGTFSNNCGTLSGNFHQDKPDGTIVGNYKATTPQVSINLVSPPPNNEYAIDTTPTMPVVQATAKVLNVSPDPTSSTQFTWTAKLTVNNGTGQVVDYSSYIKQSQTTTGTAPYTLTTVNPLTLVGSNLTLTVSATVNGRKLTTTKDGLTIVGTNPERSAIQSQIATTVSTALLDGLGASDVTDGTERIACWETLVAGGQVQFKATADGGIGPVLISSDNGVGIFQLTKPSPFSNPDLLFNWQSNTKQGVSFFSTKVPPAKGYPGQLRKASQYAAVITNTVNPIRAKAKLMPITITPAPTFTSAGLIGSTPTNQLLEDTTRGYNGYGGPKLYGIFLHEFEPDLDFLETVGNSQLPGLNTNPLVWKRVPVANRGTSGDPNYVANVTAQSAQCGN